MSMQKIQMQNLVVYRSMLMAKRHSALQASLPVDKLDERIAMIEQQIDKSKGMMQ